MMKESEISAFLDQLKSSETNVEFDEAAIMAEYRHQSGEKSSLAIKILTIFGGFLASLAFLGFFVVAGIYRSGIAVSVFGLISVATAIWINKAYDKLIIDTFSITLFASGFVLVGMGFDDVNVGEDLLLLLFIVMALFSLLITQNFIISFISILIFSGCLLRYISLHFVYQAIHAYVIAITVILIYWFVKEAKIITAGKKISRLYNPARMGLIVSLIAGLFFLSNKVLYDVHIAYPWISSVATIAGVIYIIYLLSNLFEIKSAKNKLLIYGLSLMILLPTAMAPAISGSILLILLCFLVNYKTGFGLGIMSLIFFVSRYYYDLSFSLLTKSYMMLATGLLFLLIYLFTYKMLRTNEKV